jgi:hypothetical protein
LRFQAEPARDPLRVPTLLGEASDLFRDLGVNHDL